MACFLVKLALLSRSRAGGGHVTKGVVMELLAQVSESYRVTLRAKYLPVTNHRGSRIKVSRYEGSTYGRDPQTVIVSWDYSLDTGANYAAAIAEYVRRAGWGGHWVSSMIDGGAVGVCVDAIQVGA